MNVIDLAGFTRDDLIPCPTCEGVIPRGSSECPSCGTECQLVDSSKK